MIRKNLAYKVLLLLFGLALSGTGIYFGIIKKTEVSVTNKSQVTDVQPEERHPDLGNDPAIMSLSNLTQKFVQLNHDTDSLFYSTQDLLEHKSSLKKIKNNEEINAAWKNASGQFSVVFNQLNAELDILKNNRELVSNDESRAWLAELTEYSMKLRIKFREMNAVLSRKNDNRFEYFNKEIEKLEKGLMTHLSPSEKL